jgi:OmpA-OmpF porin, OOP family
MKKMMWIPFVVSAISISSSGVMAERNDTQSGVYVGGGIGYYRINDSDFLDENDRLKDNRTAWRIYGGFEASRMFAIEAAYTDFGTSDDGLANLDVNGLSAAVLLSLPLFDYIAPYGKLGVIAWDRERSLGPLRSSDDGTDMFYGVGGRFSLTPNADLRLEYERYKIDNTDLDMVSANFQFRF